MVDICYNGKHKRERNNKGKQNEDYQNWKQESS